MMERLSEEKSSMHSLRRPASNEHFAEMMNRWEECPPLFVEEMFEASLDKWQVRGMNSAGTNVRTLLLASKGVGKSCLAAWANWYWLTINLSHEAYLSSVTADNLKSGMWKEMIKWFSRAPDWYQALWKTPGAKRIESVGNPKLRFAETVTWRREADPDEQSASAAGRHASSISFTVDEGGTIPQSLIKATEAIIEADNRPRLLLLGNANSKDGSMFKSIQDGRWEVLKVTADPEDPERSPRANMGEVKADIAKYGRGHPYVMVNHLGEFPETATSEIVSEAECREAEARVPDLAASLDWEPVVGIDCARSGPDDTVIRCRRGRVSYSAVRIAGSTPEKRSREVFSAMRKEMERRFPDVDYREVPVKIDGTGGFGGGLADLCFESSMRVEEVHFNRNADNRTRFFNTKAEMYDRMAEWIRKGGCLPESREFREEAVASKFFFKEDDPRMRILDKELVKKEIRRSPDECDAFALTFVCRDSRLVSNSEMFSSGAMKGTNGLGYDPFSDSRIGMT